MQHKPDSCADAFLIHFHQERSIHPSYDLNATRRFWFTCKLLFPWRLEVNEQYLYWLIKCISANGRPLNQHDWILIRLEQYREVNGSIADCVTCLSHSGFAVGIYTTNSPEACQYVAENSKANIIVVENHKQLQKILQVRWEWVTRGCGATRWTDFRHSWTKKPIIIICAFIKPSCKSSNLYWRNPTSGFTDRLHIRPQIEDQLPHLKAIVQYKDELKEKRPNLYTVSAQSRA